MEVEGCLSFRTMSRGRADGSSKKRLVTLVLIVVIICGLLYVYSWKGSSSPLDYGSKSLRKRGSSYLSSDEDTDESSSTSLGEDGVDFFIPKSFPVSNSLLG